MVPGERVITLMTAGNLATTQSVVGLLDERTKVVAERQPSILEAPTMFQVATLVGGLLATRSPTTQTGLTAGATFSTTLILGGPDRRHAAPHVPRLPRGQLHRSERRHPLLQIGETKYVRPILLRAYEPSMSFEGRGQAPPGVVRLHDQGQPVRRASPRRRDLHHRHTHPRATDSASTGRPVLPHILHEDRAEGAPPGVPLAAHFDFDRHS
ncbi:MAG: hypothetical protein R2695_12620 [Acidimicrobiales bacterium]